MDESTAIAESRESDPCPHCGREVGDAWLVCAWCGEQIAAPAELPAGTRLHDGRYQVLGVIGRGGFGITYEVGDRRLQRRVAVKELFPESAVRHGSMVLTPPQARTGFREARERFLREARVLARFTHPGIVRVYEVFEEHGTAYLVMELLHGRTLVDLLRQRDAPFTEVEVLDVAARVAAALRPIHQAGVLHRDVNPSNVMLTASGRVVVIDFGLARDFDQAQTVGMTRVVTPGYAPLEQYRGEARFGPSTDVYGLAATCYRLATGRVPVAAIEREGGAPIPAPHALNPAISKPVSDAILDGLELEPGHRPQEIDALLARLGIRRLPDGPRSVLIDAFDPADLLGPAPTPWPTTVSEDPPATEPGAPMVEGGRAVDGAPDETRAPDLDLTRMEGAGVPPAHRPGSTATVAEPASVVRPLTAQAVVPGTDLRAPIAVGPERPGRRKVTIPAFAVAVATAGAAPVLIGSAIVLAVLPALATYGDSVARRLRAQHGFEGSWAERRLPAGVHRVVRFVRNLAVSTFRASPIIGLAAVLLAGWYGLDGAGAGDAVLRVVLRIIGMVVGGLLVLAARDGSARFRTGLGLDEVVARCVPGGRTTERVVVTWLLAAIVVAAAFFLAPDPFPLP